MDQKNVPLHLIQIKKNKGLVQQKATNHDLLSCKDYSGLLIIRYQTFLY